MVILQARLHNESTVVNYAAATVTYGQRLHGNSDYCVLCSSAELGTF
jgi:hypothetical protein